MSENLFLNALQKIATGSLALTELIDKASGLTAAGQADPARKLYRAWINANPQHPLLYVAYFNCSALDSQCGDAAGAAEALQRAIALNADFIPGYINLGGILERSGAADQALGLWTTAVNRPLPLTGPNVSHVATALKQIARVLSERQLPERAEAAVQQCLDISPQQTDVVEQLVALRLAQCKWPVVVPSERMDRKALMRGIHPLSMAVYTDDPLLQLACADRYARQANPDSAPPSQADRRNAPIDLKSRRLRVGYVSSDLRDHAVGYLMAEFFELHAKSGTEIFVYYCGPESSSALSRRTKAAVQNWTDIRQLTDDEAAAKIAADAIDILVDVNGHTRDARTGLFARRPAPILVNWLGYPGTMGTPYHHYIVADDWIIPEGSEKYYSEKVVRLPCYQPNDRKREVAPAPTRREMGLPDDAFVYCCFNGTHKISRFTFDRWLDILKRVPGSVLWLLDSSDETKTRLKDYAQRQGVEGARLVFALRVKNAAHLARYPLADLFLDTAPYGAHTTASDALWMGVPVLTLSGRGFASRVCGSLVRSAGLPELVVTDPQTYVERATSLGLNPKQVKPYQARLAKERDRCTLFATDKLVAHLENLYRTMVDDYRKGLLPRPNLANLDAYLETGVALDHEHQELLALAGYEGLYKAALAQRHLSRPMNADGRLWTDADVAAAERSVSTKQIETPDVARRREPAPPVKRRKTATR